jgi:ADP-ribose pyrophosphatase YjhB (NUDIX family)
LIATICAADGSCQAGGTSAGPHRPRADDGGKNRFPEMQKKRYCPYCGKRLGEKHIEGRMRLYCDACSRPIYENPIPATCIIVADPCDRVVLVKRSIPPKKGEWCLPGGFIEMGESPGSGATRELLEETGLAGEIESLLGIRHAHSDQYHSIIMVGYLVRNFEGALVAGDDASDARWFPIDRLPPVAFDSHRAFIQRYRTGKTQYQRTDVTI